jgi:uncharacterized protein YndB with AHSA1/START domain
VITISVSTVIAASPADVWRAVERIETHTEWMQDAVSIEFRTEQHAGVGAEFDCLTRVGPLHTTDRFVVTRWEPDVAMGISHRGAVTGDGELTLTAWADGATRCEWTERLRFPWWLGGLVGERAGRPVLRRIWQGNLARLRSRIEATPRR